MFSFMPIYRGDLCLQKYIDDYFSKYPYILFKYYSEEIPDDLYFRLYFYFKDVENSNKCKYILDIEDLKDISDTDYKHYCVSNFRALKPPPLGGGYRASLVNNFNSIISA